MTERAVVLLSGGLDSTTVCALATSQNREVFALTFDYGQRHRFELDRAQATAKKYNVREHLIFPVPLNLFGGSSLIDRTMEIRDVPYEEIGKEIPNTYVPARNTIFLSLALAFAETRAATEIWIGVNSLDYSGYPDCRPEYIDAFAHLANLATHAGVTGTSLTIQTPLLHLRKGEIIQLGTKLGVDYAETMTCYNPSSEGLACGHCESCRLRLAGFREAGLTDPAPYLSRDK